MKLSNKPYLGWIPVQILLCFIVALLGSLALFGFILITGQTFGQRAAEKYQRGSEAWINEVNRLAHESR